MSSGPALLMRCRNIVNAVYIKKHIKKEIKREVITVKLN